MKKLSIDLETYSAVDLKKSGGYKYVESPTFEILLFAYKVDDEPVQVIDIRLGEAIPDDIYLAVFDPTVKKAAFNAAFEIRCLRKHFGRPIAHAEWYCTMVHAAMLGLPMSLDLCAKALKLDLEKDSAGKMLIRYFCVPCKPTLSNSGRTRNMPGHAEEKWEKFKEYARKDVEVESCIAEKIAFYEIPDYEHQLWALDQRINDRGVLIDLDLANAAIKMDKEYQDRLMAEAVQITGLANPKSVAQLKKWLEEEGMTVDSLTKDSISGLLAEAPTEKVNRMLEIRQLTSKTSVKKYQAMVDCAGEDGRARGLLQYYGANRTGRWSGRLIQVQNLPKNFLYDLELARRLVKAGELEEVEMMFGNVPDVLSQLIRTALVPRPGSRFIVADLSAIEARVLAWLAGEQWRLDVFATHGKIYEASASAMFKVPIEQVTKGSDYRSKAKVAELALGYQGAAGALVKMGGLKMGLTEEELPGLVELWRRANPSIVKFWKSTEGAAITCIKENRPVKIQHGIEFSMLKGSLFCKLPSGRKLSYLRARLVPGKFGGDMVSYEGVNQETKQWGRTDTYGGKWTENLCQAVARDVIADIIVRLEAINLQTVITVHDETVTEAINGTGSAKMVEAVMGSRISWCPGLPLKGEAEELEFYKK
jgi:DNA polymerase